MTDQTQPGSKFAADITTFNGMYKMPVSTKPTTEVGVALVKRLTDFKSILGKELSEIDPIVRMAQLYQDGKIFQLVKNADGDMEPVELTASKVGLSQDIEAQRLENRLDLLTALADLLGDIQVYCASEMAKFGLPLDGVQSIIMQSNFSKMGADGKPIYDEQGKLQKGPDYWKPEPKIRALLANLLADS